MREITNNFKITGCINKCPFYRTSGNLMECGHPTFTSKEPPLDSAEFLEYIDTPEFANYNPYDCLVPTWDAKECNENGIPKAVLTYEATSTGAGDIAVRAMVSGYVKQELLIVDADGDASNITNAIRDQLRDYGIIPQSVNELNIDDND